VSLIHLRVAANALAWSPDGRRIACGGTGGILRIVDTASEREIVGFHAHGGRITSLRFADSGRTLVSTSIDGTVKVWDADDLQTVQAVDEPSP
jgi:WD40 repeat protein